MTVAREENWPVEFIVYSRGELLQAQTRARFPEAKYIIGDVRDYDRLYAVLLNTDVCIHAAAMKRVPECEEHISECVMTNVIGSLNVQRACINAGVTQAVTIGTDKEVRASTAYGYSKGLSSALFINAPKTNFTKFTGVRYGNVVSSRGSVVPIWRAQCAAGEPLTVTDAGMTRFWMSPFDAVRLIDKALEAKRSEVVVGKIKGLSIAELANIVCPAAQIKEIGRRSAEKRHEDLVHEDELATEFPEHFIIGPSGHLGHKYTSDTAPKLTADEYLSMLADAERLE